MEGCPGVTQLLDYGQSGDGHLCLVTDLVPGVRLDQYVCRHGALSEAQTVALLEQLLVILAWAHTRGVVHKDVTVCNILMDGSRFVLLDWGVSELIGDGHSEKIRAKRDFVAPECYYGRHDYATDFYSLGWLTVYAITGRRPYHFDEIRDPNYRVAAHCLERPEIPEVLATPLRALILNWLEKDPNKRIRGYNLSDLLAMASGNSADFSRCLDIRQIQYCRRSGIQQFRPVKKPAGARCGRTSAESPSPWDEPG